MPTLRGAGRGELVLGVAFTSGARRVPGGVQRAELGSTGQWAVTSSDGSEPGGSGGSLSGWEHNLLESC